MKVVYMELRHLALDAHPAVVEEERRVDVLKVQIHRVGLAVRPYAGRMYDEVPCMLPVGLLGRVVDDVGADDVRYPVVVADDGGK